jgi:hypothetical protein
MVNDKVIRFRLDSDGTQDVLIRVDDSEVVRGDGSKNPETCEHDKFEWQHEFDENSVLGDWYWCTGCGDLTQVG